jgi:hypothetical protein
LMNRQAGPRPIAIEAAREWRTPIVARQYLLAETRQLAYIARSLGA